MLSVYKHPVAKSDLLECWLYIATENSPAIADKVLLKIETALNMLAENPNSGRARPELGRNLRSFPVSGYSLFYHHNTIQLDVVRVLHSAMDVERHF